MPYGDDLITDSAAGATAFSCGVKTYNAAIGVDKDTVPVETVLEIANKRGRATGLVTTTTIVHATPASFIAHQPHRDQYEEIAADFLDTPVDLFIGGGLKYFTNRADGRDLKAELTAKGYYVSDYTQEELGAVRVPTGAKLGYLTSYSDPVPVAQGRDYFDTAVQLSLGFLPNQSKKGFFMMIEGGQIDWGGHANDSDYLVSEMLEFDKVIGRVLDFARTDGETLVIVTADHETGGYSILKHSTVDSLKTAFTTDYHTGDFIPVFAFGPGAEAFSGVYQNTDICKKMKHALGY
jgi:alkaline phosphatase